MAPSCPPPTIPALMSSSTRSYVRNTNSDAKISKASLSEYPARLSERHASNILRSSVRALVGGTGDIYSFVLESIIQAKPYSVADPSDQVALTRIHHSQAVGRAAREASRTPALVLCCPDERE